MAGWPWLLMTRVLVGTALAGSVYINNVRVDELPAISLQNVSVRIDAQGDIYIDAPNYKVQVVGQSTAAAATSSPHAVAAASQVWYLVSEDDGSSSGIVDVYVNDRYVRRLESGQAQVLVDLSNYVQHGANKVQFVVRTAPSGRLGAYVGAGDPSAGNLHIDNPAVSWRSTGAQMVQEYSFSVP